MCAVAEHDGLYASVGVHPDYRRIVGADGRTAAGTRAPPEGRCDRRDRARLLPAQRAARVATRSISDAYPGCARLRQAADHPHARGGRDTLRLMAEEGADAVGGVMHCFTETAEVARRALDMGFHISFSGIVTFKNATELQVDRNASPDRPAADRDRCAVSRASPASRPAERAGFRAASWRISWRSYAESTIDVIAQATTDNFYSLFKVLRDLISSETAGLSGSGTMNFKGLRMTLAKSLEIVAARPVEHMTT